MKVVTKAGLPLAWGYKVTAVILGEQYPVSIRGWKEDEYLILDHPMIKGEFVRVAPQTSCSLNYTVKGIFINFKTAVLDTITHPVHLMVIQFPRNFVSHNLRKNDRQKAHFEIFFSRDSGTPEVTYTGTIRDLSLSGALLTHAKPLEKDETIFLNLKLPQGDIVNLPARTRNIRKNPNSEVEPFVTGLEFQKLNTQQDDVLRRFVESRVIDRRGPSRLNGPK